MKKLKFILFIGGIVLLLTSPGCKKTVYNQLSEEEVKWLVYNKDEQIIFARSGTLIDTFLVANRARGYLIDKPYYNEAASIVFYKPVDSIGGNKVGNIRATKDKDGKFQASFTFPHFPKTAILTDMTPVPLDTINGLPFNNVYIAVADTFTNSLDNYIWKVYYTRDDGFVKLVDIFGNNWYKLN